MGWSGTALEITNFKLDGQDPAPLVILVVPKRLVWLKGG